MKFLLCLALVLGSALLPASAATMNVIPLPSDGKAEAVRVAQAWAELLDKGKYDEAWNQAATQLKKAVSRKKWRSTMAPLRDPLGAVGTRQEKTSRLTREIVGAPDAQYAVVEFGTSFANKPGVSETVTLVWEKDGHWRVSSYAIK